MSTLRNKPGVKPGTRRQVFSVSLAPPPETPATPAEIARWRDCFEHAKDEAAQRLVEKHGLPLADGEATVRP